MLPSSGRSMFQCQRPTSKRSIQPPSYTAARPRHVEPVPAKLVVDVRSENPGLLCGPVGSRV